MGIANKMVGGGRITTDGGGRFDNGAASKATRMYAHLSPSTSNVGDNKTVDVTSLGDKAATTSISTSNNINKFTSGISSHHPYAGSPAFKSQAAAYQAPNKSRSDFTTPSGGSQNKKGASSATMRETRAPAPYDDPMKENAMPSDPSKKGSVGGPKGGTVALMNKMKSSGVNKMRGK